MGLSSSVEATRGWRGARFTFRGNLQPCGARRRLRPEAAAACRIRERGTLEEVAAGLGVLTADAALVAEVGDAAHRAEREWCGEMPEQRRVVVGGAARERGHEVDAFVGRLAERVQGRRALPEVVVVALLERHVRVVVERREVARRDEQAVGVVGADCEQAVLLDRAREAKHVARQPAATERAVELHRVLADQREQDRVRLQARDLVEQLGVVLDAERQ
jgi:hypothetical protein